MIGKIYEVSILLFVKHQESRSLILFIVSFDHDDDVLDYTTIAVLLQPLISFTVVVDIKLQFDD